MRVALEGQRQTQRFPGEAPPQLPSPHHHHPPHHHTTLPPPPLPASSSSSSTSSSTLEHGHHALPSPPPIPSSSPSPPFSALASSPSSSSRQPSLPVFGLPGGGEDDDPGSGERWLSLLRTRGEGTASADEIVQEHLRSLAVGNDGVRESSVLLRPAAGAAVAVNGGGIYRGGQKQQQQCVWLLPRPREALPPPLPRHLHRRLPTVVFPPSSSPSSSSYCERLGGRRESPEEESPDLDSLFPVVEDSLAREGVLVSCGLGGTPHRRGLDVESREPHRSLFSLLPSPSSSSSSSWSSRCGQREGDRSGTWTVPACGGGGGEGSGGAATQLQQGQQRHKPGQRSSSSSWFGAGQADEIRGQGQGDRGPSQGQGQAGVSKSRSRKSMGRSGGVVSLRRCRQWLGVCLPVAALLYVLLWCHSAVWSSLSLHAAPLPSTLSASSSSGFRKLLEEQEKGRGKGRGGQGAGGFNNASGLAQQRRLPSAIIIGVRKCGTRALLEFLDLHPDIVTAEDEMHFFNDDSRYRQGLGWYRNLMPASLPHQITMEKTPGYFISPIAPSRVHRMDSSVKLIVLLRHPTTRTISDYTQIFHNKQVKNESLDAFEDMVVDRDTGGINTRYKAVQISMYHHHFRQWTDVFPLGQIHVVDGDRLITDPVSEIREIESFLGLEHRIDYSLLYFNSTRGFYCMHLNATCEKCLGASKGRKHPDIQVNVMRKLNRFFQPHNKALFDLIGRKFPWS